MNLPTNNKERRLLYAAVALVLFTTLNFWLWLCCRDYTALASENAKHVVKAYEMYATAIEQHKWGQALNTITYPPLFYLPTTLLFWLSGIQTEAMALISLWPYLLLSAWATYGIARQIELSPPESLTAAFLTLTYLSVSLQQDGYLIEYAILAQVTIAIYLTLASSFFQYRWASLALGTLCGLSLLTKWTFVSYAPIALGVSLIVMVREKGQRKTRVKNALLALVVCLLLAHTWYGAIHVNEGLGTADSNFKQTFSHFVHSQSTELEVRTQEVQAQNETRSIWDWGPQALLLYLVREIVPWHLSLFIAFGIIAALIQFCRGQAPRSKLAVVLFSLLFIVVLFTFYPSQELFSAERTLRHLGPAVPLALIIGACGLPLLRRGRLPALIALNFIGLISIIGWILPYRCPFLANGFFRPTIYGVEHWSFRDPLGWFTAAQQSPYAPAVERIKAFCAAGYTPLFIFSTEQDFQPLLVELYGHGGPSAVALYRRGEFVFLDGKTQFTEPDTPVLDLSHPIFVWQDHCWRYGQDSKGRNDGCHSDSRTQRLLHDMLAASPRDEALSPAMHINHLICGEDFYLNASPNWSYINGTAQLSEGNPNQKQSP